MTNKQTLLEKIKAELKTEKNPIAISALKYMKEKAEKHKASPAIVDMFDTIRSKRTPEQQEAILKEMEASDTFAKQEDLLKNGPSYAKFLPEKIDIDVLTERLTGNYSNNKHALTDKMDAINFGHNDKEMNDPLPENEQFELPIERKLHTDAGQTKSWQNRMLEAAERAGLDTTNFVKSRDPNDAGDHEESSFETSNATRAPTEKNASDILEEGANVYRGRNETYGDSYKKQGELMKVLFPNGLELKSAKDFNRITILTTIISKLLRYSNDFSNPHDDSILDNMVYNAMLLEIDRGK